MAVNRNFTRMQVWALGWAHIVEGLIAVFTAGNRLPMLSIRLALYFSGKKS